MSISKKYWTKGGLLDLVEWGTFAAIRNNAIVGNHIQMTKLALGCLDILVLMVVIVLVRCL